MSNIFLSYAHEDKESARRLANVLESQEWNVFWDIQIPAGKTWRGVIAEKLTAADCLIVLWSKSSIASEWVIEEAETGRQREILIPVFIEEGIEPPLGFRSVQAANLSKWDGTESDETFQLLRNDISAILKSPAVPLDAGTHAPTTTLPTAGPVQTRKPFPKWIFIPIAAVVLICVALGLWLLPGKYVAVPNVVGMKLADAEAALATASLRSVEGEVQITGRFAVDQVINQDPKPSGSPVSTGTIVRLIIEGEEALVDVPDVTRRLKDDATARLKEKGFSVIETSTEVVGGLLPNQVVSQKPAGGAKAKEGATVELLVATQKVVAVPDVTFKPSNLAQNQITAAGLKFVMKEPELAPGNVPAGNIKSQNPAGGTSVPLGAVIELVAAAPSTAVPSVVGKKIAEAQVTLQSAGLELGHVSGSLNENNANIVQITSQTPTPNSNVATGSKVDVAVPQLCTVLARCNVTTVSAKRFAPWLLKVIATPPK